jgi:hypothetical protein
MKYSLLNKLNDQLLTHPRVGLWFTLDRKEAEEMLDACKEYLTAEGLKDLEENFVIVDSETKEEVA